MEFKKSLQDNQSIHLKASAKDWKEAVKLGTDLLEKSGAIEPSYYAAIVENIEKMGPYVIIAPSFAMPHARPEDGVNRTAFALVTLEKPIYFDGDETPVDVLVTLAGSSSDEHMGGLVEVIALVEDENVESGVNLDPLRNCKTVEEVYNVIDLAMNKE